MQLHTSSAASAALLLHQRATALKSHDTHQCHSKPAALVSLRHREFAHPEAALLRDVYEDTDSQSEFHVGLYCHVKTVRGSWQRSPDICTTAGCAAFD